MRIAILGDRSRDVAMGERLCRGNEISVFGRHVNPDLDDIAKLSGGSFHVIPNIKTDEQAEAVAPEIADTKPEVFLTHWDNALAAGITDAVAVEMKKRGLECLIPCPDKEATQIESDNFFFRELIQRIHPEYNPEYALCTTKEEAYQAIESFRKRGKLVVIKPRNLSDGKGARVMSKHFTTYDQVHAYADEVLDNPDQTGVEINEELTGQEVTFMIMTDGKVLIRPPATCDYAYRDDDDTGNSTGGAASISMAPGEHFPFMNQDIYDDTMKLADDVNKELRRLGINYKGVLYMSMIITPIGLKIIEINARGGEGEFVNTLDTLEDDVDLLKIMKQIATGTLDEREIRFKPMASVLIFAMHPLYTISNEHVPIDFYIDREALREDGVLVRFSASERKSDSLYTTTGNSRNIGFLSLAKTPRLARANINNGLAKHFPEAHKFHIRNDPGNRAYGFNLR